MENVETCLRWLRKKTIPCSTPTEDQEHGLRETRILSRDDMVKTAASPELLALGRWMTRREKQEPLGKVKEIMIRRKTLSLLTQTAV